MRPFRFSAWVSGSSDQGRALMRWVRLLLALVTTTLPYQLAVPTRFSVALGLRSVFASRRDTRLALWV